MDGHKHRRSTQTRGYAFEGTDKQYIKFLESRLRQCSCQQAVLQLSPSCQTIPQSSSFHQATPQSSSSRNVTRSSLSRKATQSFPDLRWHPYAHDKKPSQPAPRHEKELNELIKSIQKFIDDIGKVPETERGYFEHEARRQNDLTLSVLISGSREAAASLFCTGNHGDIRSAVSTPETVDVAVSVELRNIAEPVNPEAEQKFKRLSGYSQGTRWISASGEQQTYIAQFTDLVYAAYCQVMAYHQLSVDKVDALMKDRFGSLTPQYFYRFRLAAVWVARITTDLKQAGWCNRLSEAFLKCKTV